MEVEKIAGSPSPPKASLPESEVIGINGSFRTIETAKGRSLSKTEFLPLIRLVHFSVINVFVLPALRGLALQRAADVLDRNIDDRNMVTHHEAESRVVMPDCQRPGPRGDVMVDVAASRNVERR
jgi:hypothetical protein